MTFSMKPLHEKCSFWRDLPFKRLFSIKFFSKSTLLEEILLEKDPSAWKPPMKRTPFEEILLKSSPQYEIPSQSTILKKIFIEKDSSAWNPPRKVPLLKRSPFYRTRTLQHQNPQWNVSRLKKSFLKVPFSMKSPPKVPFSRRFSFKKTPSAWNASRIGSLL